MRPWPRASAHSAATIATASAHRWHQRDLASKQRDDHGPPERQEHVADGIRHTVTESRHRALCCFLDGRKRRRRRAGARAHAEQDAGVHLEHPPAEHDPDHMRNQDGDQAGDEQARATRPQADHEVGAGVEADDRDETSKSDRLEHPQRGRGDAPEEARPHRAQPATDEAAQQHADLRLSPISSCPSTKAGMPISAPATMPNATRAISVASVARSGTPMRFTASVVRLIRTDDGEDVAAMQAVAGTPAPRHRRG